MRPGRLVLGLALVVAGALVILDGVDVIDAGATIADWWPMALVALGAVQWLIDPATWVGSLLLIAIGTVLLLGNLTGLVSSLWPIVWPLAIIAAGAWVIWGRVVVTRTETAGTLRTAAVLGSRRVAVGGTRFVSGDVTVVAGGLQLDLTEAELASAARLSVTVLLGALEVLVPPGWDVRVSGVPLLAAWDTTIRRDRVEADAPTLEVRALAVLGGMEVRHPERWA
jgi:hypothetical protein